MELLRIYREKNPGWSNPKSVCVCVCCFSDVFGWYLELETSIFNGCLVKQPFLKSRFSKNHPTSASIDINGCLRFQVVILGGRQPKNMTLSFRKKKINGMSTRARPKVPLSSDFWTVQKVVFSQQKKSEMVTRLEFSTQFFMNL